MRYDGGWTARQRERLGGTNPTEAAPEKRTTSFRMAVTMTDDDGAPAEPTPPRRHLRKRTCLLSVHGTVLRQLSSIVLRSGRDSSSSAVPSRRSSFRRRRRSTEDCKSARRIRHSPPSTHERHHITSRHVTSIVVVQISPSLPERARGSRGAMVQPRRRETTPPPPPHVVRIGRLNH